MKSLSDFIYNKSFKRQHILENGSVVLLPYQCVGGYRLLDDFLYENNLSTDDICDELINDYNICEWHNEQLPHTDFNLMIDEMLKSHNHEQLAEKIYQLFGDKIEGFDTYESKSKIKSFFIVTKPKYNIEADKRFLWLLDMFRLTLSKVETTDHIKKIYLEPEFPSIVNDMIKNKYHNIIYHITLAKNIERIKKRGLQLKKAIYRDFVERVYYFGACNDKEFQNTIDKICNIKNYNKDDITVIKIDLNKCTYENFYQDTSMKEQNMFFYYGYFMPNQLEFIKYKI